MKEKLFLLLIFIFTALSLTAVNLALASIPKPSAPEFTLSYVLRPYDIEPSYTIDPYTGENITFPGIHTKTAWVLITVENQPFSPYTAADGNYIELWYNVSLKGHFADTWSHYPSSRALDLYNSSASGETVIDIPLGEWPELGPNSQLDFRLEALIGHFNYDYYHPSAITGFSTYEASDWSDMQTITVHPSSSSPTPTPLPTSTESPEPQPEPFPTTIVIAITLIIAVVCIVSLVYFKKLRK